MDMIAKDKKEIRWIGLPNNTAVGLDALRTKKRDKEEELERKQSQFDELQLQATAYKRIIARNQENPPVPEHKRIYMPFIVVKTNKQNNIDCEVEAALSLLTRVAHLPSCRLTQLAPVSLHRSLPHPLLSLSIEVTEDYHEIFFNFTSNFEILNDMEILKKMGMHKPEEADQPVAMPTAAVMLGEAETAVPAAAVALDNGAASLQ